MGDRFESTEEDVVRAIQALKTSTQAVHSMTEYGGSGAGILRWQLEINSTACQPTLPAARRMILEDPDSRYVHEENDMTTTQTYVLTVPSTSRSALRVWTGRSVHQLRHCSTRHISHVLAEMQQHLDHLRHSLEPSASAGSCSLNRGR